jgi:RND family efflux transporter MFP subunit
MTAVTTSAEASRIRVPGVVQANAYKEVIVTPLVGGRITRVHAELGQVVGRGQTLAEVYSSELTEAQRQYLSARAELEAHEQQLRRTERLVEIGAASKQELEKIHAEHTAQTTEVEGARSRLVLLGLSADQLSSLTSAAGIITTANIPAPLAGVVVGREANVGLNVEPSTPLFKVVDLSTVWVVGELYERDFTHVRVGSSATITTTAYPGRALQGRVSYIDPQLESATRTAQLRVEVPNPRGELRLGMYADMEVGDARPSTVVGIPRPAVQMVGDRSVVYLVRPNQPGTFIEREVRLGDTIGDKVVVTSGLQAGDAIVASGSFALRAERERLGLRSSLATSVAASGNVPAAGASGNLAGGGAQAAPGVQTARVTVSEQGFEPSQLTLRAGVPARITFLRTSDKTCGTEVVFPALQIKRALPLNEPVTVDLTPQNSGSLTFICGMNMLRGTIVVR